MVAKKRLFGVNNYCKTAHTMKEMGVLSITSINTFKKIIDCLESNVFEIEKIRPNFMYSKWLTKE